MSTFIKWLELQATQFKQLIKTLCSMIAQAIIHWPLIIKAARIPSDARACGIYGGQSDTEKKFLWPL